MKRHVIVKASLLLQILLFSSGIPMRQQLAACCAWSAVLLMLAATNVAPLRAEDASKPAAKVELSREERIEQALDRPCELAFKSKSLDGAAAELEKHYGFAVRLDNKVLMEAGVEYETPVILMKSGSLAGALKQMLAPYELTFDVRHEAVMITTSAWAADHAEIRIYEVHDITTNTNIHDSVAEDGYEILTNAILASDALETPQHFGGLTAARMEGTIVPYRQAGALVVSDTRDRHRDIELLLAAIRSTKESTDSKERLPETRARAESRRWVVRTGFVDPKNHGRDIDKSRANNRIRIEEALRAECSRDIKEASLDDFMNEIATRCKLRFVFDQKALMEAGVQSDLPTVCINMQHLSCRSALEMVLDEHDLTWLVEDEFVLITTKVEAEMRLESRLYPVSDLITSRALLGGCTSERDAASLAELIVSIVCPTGWSEVGGPAQDFTINHLGILTFLQARDVHEQIEQILAMLREVKARQLPEGKLEPMPEKAGDGLVLRVYEVSAKPKVVGGGFFNFDDKQPAAAGTPAEKPKAETAKPPETAKCDAPAAPTVNPDHVLAEQLVKAIPELIEPKSWQAGGGEGKIFAVGPRLLVRQTCEVHAHIKDLLKAIGQ